MRRLLCKLGFHSWAKCIHGRTGLYLYSQKFCIHCYIQDIGYTDREVDKKDSLAITEVVLYN